MRLRLLCCGHRLESGQVRECGVVGWCLILHLAADTVGPLAGALMRVEMLCESLATIPVPARVKAE